ncbi:MAG TPA: DUF2934 domain-containing protein [Candidatus Acidoferrum sp.]|nr:DUF2934 domain-containing protein [Candidatus Acidoferrum sp.]
MPKSGKSPAPTVKKSRAAGSHPTTEEIALRAYHIYLERKGAPGNPLDDWTRAERELLEKPVRPRRKLGPKLVAA